MGILKPAGVPLVLDGVERRLLFTLNAIDGIQEKFNAPLNEVMCKLVHEETANDTLKSILAVLLNDEVERLSYKGGKCELELVDEKQMGWLLTNENDKEALYAVLTAYGIDLPEPDDDDPNRKSGQQKH